MKCGGQEKDRRLTVEEFSCSNVTGTLRHVKGNTWYLEGDVSVPVVLTGPGQAVLLDSGYYGKSTEPLMEMLDANGLKPLAVLTSHYHPDHVGNHLALREKYGTELIMSRKTAGVLEEPEIIAMTYWQMNPVWVREHLGFMKIRPDRVFDGNDGCTGIDECAGAAENGSVIRAGGADFRVIPLPGHTMDQVGYVTPDGVLYAADAMLERDFLAHAKLPTARSWTVDLETKAGIPAGNYPAVILAHRGCVQGPEILRLSWENIRDRHRRAEELYDVLARRGRELTLEEIQNTLWRALELRTKQELKIRIFQRNVFCLVRYLEDTGRVKEESRDGKVLYRLGKGENEN